MKGKFLVAALIITLSFNVGCMSNKNSSVDSKALEAVKQPINSYIDSDENGYASDINPIENDNEIKEDPEKIVYISPYTGLEISKETLDNIPFLAIVENSKLARPQSGLSEADIVFETMAEGGIPRFIALFHSNSPKEIGPIRSARPYFLVLSKEFNLPLAHCGGSSEALNSIKSENLMSLNEFFYGKYYWRDHTRKAPHNLYTSAEKLRAAIKDNNYIRTPLSSLTFNDSYWKDTSNTANIVNMKLNPQYTTIYNYRDGYYYKYIDDKELTDKSNNKTIYTKNIVVQVTHIETRSDLRLNITQVGNGAGYLISQGKYVKIKWNKENENSPTLLKDENGNNVFLSPGNTWWHIVDENSKITFQ